MERLDRSSRQKLARIAIDTRMACVRAGMPVSTTVDEILRAAPQLSRLEAWRFANGWTRAEVSARLDALYEADGLTPPMLSDAEICRWEHTQRRPSDERIEYLCKLYGTRPDRLGYGSDFSAAEENQLQGAGISNLWPRTNDESLADLVARVHAARDHITVIGLTRNFYARDHVLPLIEARAAELPVTFFSMDPRCESRRDRYRLEPAEATMEDPGRYVREVLRPLYQAAQRVAPVTTSGAGLNLYLYNFPAGIAIEKIDDHIRVMMYGYGKRGTDSPIMVFEPGTPYHQYFDDQVRWFNQMASEAREPWVCKGLVVRPLTSDDLAAANPPPELQDRP